MTKVEWEKYEIEDDFGHKLCLLPLTMHNDYYVLVSKFPVKNIQYKKYLLENNESKPIGEDFKNGFWEMEISPLDNEDFNHDDQPIVCVSYADTVKYLSWLNKKEDKIQYKLLSTSLWEFATFGRIGEFQVTENLVYNQKIIFNKPDILNENSKENLFGLVGLIGNIWEWVDPINDSFYSNNNLISRMMSRRISTGITSGVILRLIQSMTKEIRGTSYLDNSFETEPRLSTYFLKDGLGTKHTDLGFRISALIHSNELPEKVLSAAEQFSNKILNSYKKITFASHIEKPNKDFYKLIEEGQFLKAIEIISNFEVADLEKTLTLLKFRYKKNDSNFNNGIITYEEKNVYELRIISSLLEIYENYA